MPPLKTILAPQALHVRRSRMDVFIASRTTLDDLSRRLADHGTFVAPGAIAAYLTGRTGLAADQEDEVAEAINARLRELGMPPTAA